MKPEELIKRVDKAITELISIKVELQNSMQPELFPNVPKKKVFNNDDAIEIIQYLSSKLIKLKLISRPLKETKSRIKVVNVQLNESSIFEAKKVIDSRCIVWGHDENNSQYLTIETMFRPSKYTKYLEASDLIIKNQQKSFDNGHGSVGQIGNWTD